VVRGPQFEKRCPKLIVTKSICLRHINRRPFVQLSALIVLCVGCGEASFILVVTVAAVCAAEFSPYIARENWRHCVCV